MQQFPMHGSRNFCVGGGGGGGGAGGGGGVVSRPNGQKTAWTAGFFSPQLILQFTEGVQWFYY